MSDQKTVLLVDGSSYLYRAFHAMPDLRVDPTDPASAATGAVRGMLNMLRSLQKDYPTEYAACIFDASGPTFRDTIYPEYKANRSAMPDDLRSQIEPIHKMVALMGWKVLAVQGVEADDVIGTLSHKAAEAGYQVVISSGDKDLSQLVNERVMMIDTMNGKKRDVAGVTAEFGVPPGLMLDYQTLVGDAVDNVPGVSKVGPKTAVKWLQAYGSLDGVVAHAAQITGAVGENLRLALDWLPTGRELLKIKTDCDLQSELPALPALDDLRVLPEDNAALLPFFQAMGFKSLVKNMEQGGGGGNGGGGSGAGRSSKTAASVGALAAQDLFADAPAASSSEGKKNYTTILDWVTFDQWLAKIESAALTAVDTETTSLDEMRAEIVGISFSVNPGEAAYIPLAHDYPAAPTQLPRDEVLAKLKPWLENPQAKKLGQHVKYDQHVFANHGIAMAGIAHDTMLESYVLEVHRPHGLSSLAERHVGRKGIQYEDLCGKGVNQISFSQVDIERASEYSCEDSDQTLDVHLALWPRIEKAPKLSAIYALEMTSSDALFHIECNGVLIDAKLLQAQSKELGTRIIELEGEAHALAGQTFNLASPKQIGEIFFGKLGLPVVKKTPKGEPSTDEEVLEKLAEDYPLPAKLLEFRSLAKLKNTYTDKLALLALPRTGRVHTHYAQAVAVTGRLASNDPNLQNIPIRTAEGRRVREAFVAPAGSQIVSADYSQIELRIMAHLSEDAALLKAFADGEDVHRATAAEVFGVALDAVSSEQRRYAKVINFGLIYGMSAFGLAKSLGIDNSAARNYIDRYFERYPGVKRYMDATKAQAKAQGFVETVFGRRLYLPEINSPNGPRRAGAERAAINAPMQGTAADLIKMSMVAVQNRLQAEAKSSKMIMQVHDELVFEVPEAELAWVRETIPSIMAGVASLKVPLLAEVGVGNNWDEAH